MKEEYIAAILPRETEELFYMLFSQMFYFFMSWLVLRYAHIFPNVFSAKPNP